MTLQEVYIVTHCAAIVGVYSRQDDAEAVMRLTVEAKNVPEAWTNIERRYVLDQVAAEDVIQDMEDAA